MDERADRGRGERVKGWHMGSVTARRIGSSAAAVLYVARSSRIDGANRMFIDLMAGLDSDRFTPYLVAPSPGALTEWADSAGIPSRIVADGDLAGRVGLVKRLPPLVAAARSAQADIIHAIDVACYRAAGLASSFVGAKRVCHVHGSATADDLSWALQYGPEMLLTRCQAQARAISRALGDSKPGCRVIGVPGAVDSHLFAPRSRAASAACRFGGRHVVLIGADCTEATGPATFLRACALIDACVPGCEFVVLAGKTLTRGHRDELARSVRGFAIEHQVHWLESSENLADVINAADVVLLSPNEGVPLSALEAMACGKPVVATPGGVSEVIDHDATGMLVPQNDPDALAGAAIEILRDPALARRLGRLARHIVEAQFSMGVFVDRIQDLYDTLLDSGRPALPSREWAFAGQSLLLAAGVDRV